MSYGPEDQRLALLAAQTPVRNLQLLLGVLSIPTTENAKFGEDFRTVIQDEFDALRTLLQSAGFDVNE